MPLKSNKQCAKAACWKIIDGSLSYCPKHKPKPFKNILRNNTKIYNTRRWRKLSKKQLADEPLCRSCKKKGKVMLATHSDHIISISEGGEPFEQSNLQSLCIKCHTRKTFKHYGRTINS